MKITPVLIQTIIDATPKSGSLADEIAAELNRLAGIAAGIAAARKAFDEARAAYNAAIAEANKTTERLRSECPHSTVTIHVEATEIPGYSLCNICGKVI